MLPSPNIFPQHISSSCIGLTLHGGPAQTLHVYAAFICCSLGVHEAAFRGEKHSAGQTQSRFRGRLEAAGPVSRYKTKLLRVPPVAFLFLLVSAVLCQESNKGALHWNESGLQNYHRSHHHIEKSVGLRIIKSDYELVRFNHYHLYY